MPTRPATISKTTELQKIFQFGGCSLSAAGTLPTHREANLLELLELLQLLNSLSCMSQPPIERKQLLKTVLKNGVFTSADVREIRLLPGQQAGRHLHPCAVLGYIVDGTAVYQVEGEPEQILPAGSAFHEPAGAIIAEFGNASDSEPMTFVAFYLLNGEQDLIQMLDRSNR